MTTAPAHFVIRYRAPNDKNGNPRRVYVVYGSDETVISTIDEGYAGYAALPAQYQTLPKVDVDATPAVYRSFLKIAR